MIAVERGRGAWPSAGTGGTLSLTGARPGAFYRAPTGTSKYPGSVGARGDASVDLNSYAVYMAVRDFQARVKASVVDGVFGPQTAASVKVVQANLGLVADGIVGPATCRAIYTPLIVAAAKIVDYELTALPILVRGHIGIESGFDPGAVGVLTPTDVGIAQINGPAHPAMTLDMRLTPATAIMFATNLISANVHAMGVTHIDDGIAAYVLGVAGAKSWVAAGRPEMWGRTNVLGYIAKVHAASLL